jgi:hypothetical protein
MAVFVMQNVLFVIVNAEGKQQSARQHTFRHFQFLFLTLPLTCSRVQTFQQKVREDEKAV